MKKISFLIIMLLVSLGGCVDKPDDNSNKPYNVSFIGLNDDTFKISQVTSDDEIVYPDAPTEVGYTFIGWEQPVKAANGDVTIKAKYKILTYDVKFFDYSGKLLKIEIVSYNQNATAPTEGIERDGYEFIGWDKTFTNVLSNLNVYPLYNINKFTVTFYDAENNVLSTQEVNKGENAIAPTAPEILGSTFTSWDKTFTNVQTNLEVRPIYTTNKYDVNFYDANNNIISTQKVEYGASAVAPDSPLKDGHTFVAWDTSYDNVTTNLDIKPMYLINQYTIKFYNASGTVISEQLVSYGSSATAPSAPAKAGAIFKGWDKTFTNVSSNLDIYPVYNDIYYSVTFKDMFGDVIDTQSVVAYTAATAPTPPTVDYYTFSKWDKSFSSVTSNLIVTAVYTKNNTTYSQSTADYWLQILSDKYNITETLLTPTEIDSFNEKIFSDYSSTKVVDFNDIAKTATKSTVNTMITNYSNISKYTVYNASTGSALSSSQKTTILNNRNLDAIPSTVTVKFGLIVDFAWMRSYPTNHYSDKLKFDRFQETSLNTGEGVAIYHESSDGEWYFVQAQNYNGWVEKKYIAECSFTQMTSFLNATNKLLVIGESVKIEGAHVRMGQAFPLTSTTSSNYTISFPTRNTDGTLNLKSVTLAKTNDYHVGYLEYNYKNLYTQAFKLLGIEYSWGDKYKEGRDCSSTMNAFYSCFGFKMARNTGNQLGTPTYGVKTTFTTTTIKNYHPGTLVYTSSHVMMYLGQDANGNPYLLHNTNASDAGCILQSLASYGTSRMIGLLKMQ